MPVAFHLRLAPLVSSPSAMPDSLRSPAQVALKAPFAVVAVCSLTVHLKSPQALGDGMMLAEVHVPMNAFVPAAAGPVTVLLCSKLKQPDAAIADTATTTEKILFFMLFVSAG